MIRYSKQRPGFTLVEMLIVLFIIVAVAGIFIPVILNLTDRNQVAKGTSILENAFALAKARAAAEKRPSGVRIALTAPNLRTTTSGPSFAWYDELQYIEDPGDYSNGWVWGLADPGLITVTQPFWNTPTPSPGIPPVGFDAVTVAAAIPNFTAMTASGQQTITAGAVPRSQLLFGPISPIVSGGDNNRWVGNSGTSRLTQRMAYNWYARIPVPVQPGDMVEIEGVGELYQVLAVSLDQVAGNNNTNVNISGNANPIRVPIIVLDRSLPRNLSPSLNGSTNYRIIRQPRAVSSISPVKLPQDVVIDLTPSRSSMLGAGADTDTSGSIYMTNVSSGVNVSGITGLTTATPGLVAPDYIDIMFSPSGEIIQTSQVFRPSAGVAGNFAVGGSGLIALWLHQRGDPNNWAARQITSAQGNADNQAIVAVNARTGFIGSYPVDRNSGDPLANARIGKARISADTGP